MIDLETAKYHLQRKEVRDAVTLSFAFGAASSVFSAIAMKHIEPHRDLSSEIAQAVGVGVVTTAFALAWRLRSGIK